MEAKIADLSVSAKVYSLLKISTKNIEFKIIFSGLENKNNVLVISRIDTTEVTGIVGNAYITVSIISGSHRDLSVNISNNSEITINFIELVL